MADYVPYTWEDRVVEKPRTYTIQENEDGTVTLIPEPGTIYNEGTKVTAARMNYIEQGIVSAHQFPLDYGLGGPARDISGSDLNALDKTGFYLGTNLANSPNTTHHYYIVHIQHTSTNGATQIIIRNSAVRETYFRTKASGTWGAWSTYWHSDNDRGFMGNMKSLPSFTDYNELITPGVYHGIYTDPKTNEPITSLGGRRVKIVVEAQGTDIYQEIYYLHGVGQGAAFWRYMNEGTWRGFGGMAPVGRLRRAQVNAQMDSWTTILDISGANGRLEYLRDVYTGSEYTMQYRLTIDGVVDTVSFGSARVHYYLGQPTDSGAFDEVRASDPIIFSNSLKIETLASTTSPVEVVAEYRLRPGAP